MARLRIGAALFAVAAAVAFGVANARAADGVPAFAKLRQSLAIIAAPDGKGVAFGSAFCIESDSKRSIFLTNAHVVKDNDVVAVRTAIDHKIYKGFVLRVSVEPLDAAVIEIQRGDIPPLTLSSTQPAPGTAIAIAGYPSIQLDTDLEPSVHAGIINDVFNHYYLEHDAVTDHGNSGGPLFDVQTGVVYGIVTAIVPSSTARAVQNNLAIAADKTFAFLGNAGVTALRTGPSDAVAAAAPTPPPLASAIPSPAPPPPESSVTPAPQPTAALAQPAPRPTLVAPPSGGSRISAEIDAAQHDCSTAVDRKTYSKAIDACNAYVHALEPLLESVKGRPAAEKISLARQATDAMFYLTLAYTGAEDLKTGRQQALYTVGWAYVTIRALYDIDPHFYNADHRVLRREAYSYVAAIELFYPGVTDAELKVIEKAER